jgi:[ribosomal protein S5]-alanine N-acetyltransferase
MTVKSTSRIELRTPTVANRDEFISAMRASRKLHGAWLTAPSTPAAYDALLERALDVSFEPMLACLVDGGAIVGFFNISQIIRGPLQSAFLGYGGVAAHAGRGYMTEGLGLVLRRTFTELGLHRLEANIQPGNLPSIALVQRCGFVREGFSERYLRIAGRWRDHERWAIRAEQWRDMARFLG